MATQVIALVLGLACLLTIRPTVGVGPMLPPGEAVFDVVKFGAKPDGVTDNSMELIRAWRAACDSVGPARVVIPAGNFMAGEVIFAGPCTARPFTVVEIRGNLMANPDMSMYSGGAWIMFQHVDNVIVTGGGTINGQGSMSWEYADGENPLPVSLVFERVGNGQINNLKFVDSMGFHMKVTDSHDVVLTRLMVTAPGNSPNTDGCHISSSTNINVTDSTISTGDDCVSIGQGNTNVMVTRIICGPGHGISIGSLGKRPDETNVRGVSVTNCTLTGTTNGARIKTYHDSPRLSASAILFQDMVMNDVKNPIIIDQHYNSEQRFQQSNVKISDVHFVNIRGSSVSPVAVSLNCSKTNPCEGVELTGIDLVPSKAIGVVPLTFGCSSARTIFRGKVYPPAPLLCV